MARKNTLYQMLTDLKRKEREKANKKRAEKVARKVETTLNGLASDIVKNSPRAKKADKELTKGIDELEARIAETQKRLDALEALAKGK